MRKNVQADLAKTLGITVTILKNWQTGKTEIPASKIVALASVFSVSTDYLLGLNNDQNSA